MAIQTFDDVAPGDFAYDHIEALVAAEITAGTSKEPPLFSPSAACTQAQVRVFLMRARAYVEKGFDPQVPKEDSSTPPPFVDTPPSHWAYSYIARAARLGVDGGPERLDRDPGELGEATQITRGQFAVVCIRALRELPLDDKTTAEFADVPTSHPKFGYVEKIYALDISAGVGGSPKNFGVDQLLTRAQMAVLIVKAFDLPFVTGVPVDQ